MDTPLSIVVTGASAGLGRSTAIEFASRGNCVALIARDSERLISVQREVENAGGKALVLPADVADADAIEQASDRVVREWGRIDVWVNCAMATVFAPVYALTYEEFRRATEVTYLGYVYGTMAALKHMRSRDSGTIVQVGSALSYRAIPLQSAYCGAKFAIRGFTDALRSELIHEKSRIRITMVQMPALNTPQFDWARNKLPRRPMPIPPIFQPEVGARAIVRATLRAPRELWVGRSAVEAILGAMAVPEVLDGLLARKGYDGQLTSEAADPSEPGNLFSPVRGDFRAHGRFDGEAIERVALVLSSSTIRKFIGWTAFAGIAATLVSLLGRKSKNARDR